MKKKIIILPKHKTELSYLGENIKLARLRRKLTMKQVSERANISNMTLWHIETGKPNVAMGLYYNVLLVLGLENYFHNIALDDVLGRKLQDIELLTKQACEDINYRNICFKYHKNECVICKENIMVHVHHMDENHDNNEPSNLIPLCATHHGYFHSPYKNLVEPKIIEYINDWKSKH